MAGIERPGCQAAIVQALRFHFGLRPKDIAVLLNIQSQRVSMMTDGYSLSILCWKDRKFQSDAIEKAEVILKTKEEEHESLSR